MTARDLLRRMLIRNSAAQFSVVSLLRSNNMDPTYIFEDGVPIMPGWSDSRSLCRLINSVKWASSMATRNVAVSEDWPPIRTFPSFPKTAVVCSRVLYPVSVAKNLSHLGGLQRAVFPGGRVSIAAYGQQTDATMRKLLWCIQRIVGEFVELQADTDIDRDCRDRESATRNPRWNTMRNSIHFSRRAYT